MKTGGSRRGVGRWAGVAAGAVLALLVTTAGAAVGAIPMPVIGALVAIVGLELLAARIAEARRRWGHAPGRLLVFGCVLLAAAHGVPPG